MSQTNQYSIFELTCCLEMELQAHSLSNAGSQQSNRMMPRQQALADGTDADAISGKLLKQRHASMLGEYLINYGDHLCTACWAQDPQRAAVAQELGEQPRMEEILACGLCDLHGFLIPAKKATNGAPERLRRSKDTVINFSMGLAPQEHYHASQQIFTRRGRSAEDGDDNNGGQMIFKTPVRSGQYALVMRYTAANIGVDDASRKSLIADETVRKNRHRAVLYAFHDLMLSPDGANTATLMPHLSSMRGALVMRTTPGRAPTYSPMKNDFVEVLQRLCSIQPDILKMYPFASVVDFSAAVHEILEIWVPFQRSTWQVPVVP